MDESEVNNLPRVVLVLRACILNNSNSILLVKRSKYDRYAAGKWELPGGKLKMSQDPFQALYEEVEQETGLEIVVKYDLVYFNGHLNQSSSFYNGAPYVVIVVACSFTGSKEVELSHEHDEFVWVTPQKALDMDIKDEDSNAIRSFKAKGIL